MKACVLEKPYDVRIKELPIPEPKDDEVLLRVTAVSYTHLESAGLGNNEYYRVFIDERYLIGEDKYSSMQRLFFGYRKS